MSTKSEKSKLPKLAIDPTKLIPNKKKTVKEIKQETKKEAANGGGAKTETPKKEAAKEKPKKEAPAPAQVPDAASFGAVSKTKVVHSGKWLNYVVSEYTLPTSAEPREWESVQRTTRGPSGIDALRPALDGPVLEFPAGLIDKGESSAQAALRELKEEVGMKGEVCFESGVLASEPGVCAQTEKMVFVDVDLGSAKEPKPEPEETEYIKIITVPIRDLPLVVERYEKAGYKIDVRVGCFMLGLTMSKALEERSSKGNQEEGGSSAPMLLLLSILFIVVAAIFARDFLGLRL